jgi:RNA polymerase primary sigma factor
MTMRLAAPATAAMVKPMITDRSTTRPVASSFTDGIEDLLANARRRPLLTAAEEVLLAQRMEAGDASARERLILSNVRLVVSVARAYQTRGVPLADLVQEGMIGLIRAVDRFDWRRGFRFSTYGTIWIRKYVCVAAERNARPLRVPPSLLRRARRAAVAEQELTVRLGRRPTDAELADAVELSVEDLHRARIADQTPISLDRPLSDDDEAATMGDLIANGDPAPHTVAAARWQTRALAAAVASLPDTERTVIQLRFGAAADGGRARTFDEIGGAIGRSAERARQIEDRALRRLAAKHDLATLRPAA